MPGREFSFDLSMRHAADRWGGAGEMTRIRRKLLMKEAKSEKSAGQPTNAEVVKPSSFKRCAKFSSYGYEREWYETA
jgi:hypothetical protein